MERAKPVFLYAAILAFSLLAGSSLFWLGRKFGASQWLTGVTILTCVIFASGLWNYHRLDEMRKKAFLLLLGCFLPLTVVSFVDEYVVDFFEPSRLYVLLAVLPAMVFMGYRLLAEKYTFNAEAKNRKHDDFHK